MSGGKTNLEINPLTGKRLMKFWPVKGWTQGDLDKLKKGESR